VRRDTGALEGEPVRESTMADTTERDEHDAGLPAGSFRIVVVVMPVVVFFVRDERELDVISSAGR